MKNLLPLLCLLSVLLPLRARGDDAPATATERWFDVTDIGENVFKPKKPVVLSPAMAQQIFQLKGKPPQLNFVPSWRDRLEKAGLQIEEAPGVVTSHADLRKMGFALEDTSTANVPGSYVFKFKQEKAAFVEVQRFSSDRLQVVILKPYGYYLWHRYYECLASFSIGRSTAIDNLFGLSALESVYCVRVKGIGYGDSTEAVVKALGKPDDTMSYQPFGMLDYTFVKERIQIHFEDFRVKTIMRVPDKVK